MQRYAVHHENEAFPGPALFLAEPQSGATCEVDVVADKLTHVRVEMFPR
jgi:hypothetical protein